MISFLYLFIVPIIGIALLLFKRIIRNKISDEIIVFSAMIVNAVIFSLGLIFGFSNFNLIINSSISFSVSFTSSFITLPFLFLGIVLPIPILLFAKKEIKGSKSLFYLFYLVVYLSVIGVFLSVNLIMFFLFWELAVLGLFFITSFWGKGNKPEKAGMKFLVFTQFGSLTLLAVFILLFIYTGSFNFNVIASKMSSLPSYIEYVSFFLLLITVMIKMPLFPLHEWLPDSYYYSPSAGTMLLSGMLSKLGGFAFILFGFGLFRNVLINLRIPLIALGVFSAVYIAFTATGQRDLKMLFSYSSMFYMALVFIGVSSAVQLAVVGSVILMISHGFIIVLLFGIAHMLLEKTGTYNTKKMGGLMSNMPFLSFFTFFAVFASLGVPGLSNFPGELLVFIGSYTVAGISLIAIFGIMLSTNYYLRFMKEAIFGKIPQKLSNVKDINKMEVITFSFLGFFILLIGLFPSLITTLVGGL